MAIRGSKSRIAGTVHINAILAFVFGVIFITVMLIIGVIIPNPTPESSRIFITVLALAAAGVGAVLPGFLEVKHRGVLRAGGALALFALVYLSKPAIEENVVRLETPAVAAEPVAEELMTKLDAGDLSAAWNLLDEATKQVIVSDQQQFESLVESVRQPLGAVEQRTYFSSNGAVSPQGFPPGVYRALSYRTKFANSASCFVEQVTVRATQDLSWKPFTYQVFTLSPVPCDSVGQLQSTASVQPGPVP